MAYPLIFEAYGSDADQIKSYFDHCKDTSLADVTDMSLIIFSRNREEFFRWNFLSYVPKDYKTSIDGRTRFHWVPKTIPNLRLPVQAVGLPKPRKGVISNPENKVEISGITNFFPQVECDEANRTLTLTYLFDEELPNADIYNWVTFIIDNGADESKDISVIHMDNGNPGARRNYFGCFPIKYEQFTGFALPEKLQSRVTLSYNWCEDT